MGGILQNMMNGGDGVYGPKGMYGGLGDPQRSAIMSMALLGGGLGMMGGGGLAGGLRGALGATQAQLQQIEQVAQLQRQKQMEEAFRALGSQMGGQFQDPSVQALMQSGVPEAIQMGLSRQNNMESRQQQAQQHSQEIGLRVQEMGDQRAYRNQVLKMQQQRLDNGPAGNNSLAALKAQLVGKVSSGQPLTPEEQQAWQMLSNPRGPNSREQLAQKMMGGAELTPGDQQAMALYGVDPTEMAIMQMMQQRQPGAAGPMEGAMAPRQAPNTQAPQMQAQPGGVPKPMMPFNFPEVQPQNPAGGTQPQAPATPPAGDPAAGAPAAPAPTGTTGSATNPGAGLSWQMPEVGRNNAVAPGDPAAFDQQATSVNPTNQSNVVNYYGRMMRVIARQNGIATLVDPISGQQIQAPGF